MIRKINNLLILIVLIGSILVLSKSKLDLIDTLKTLSIFLSINVLYILKLKIEIDDKINLVYIIFIILAHFLGVILNFYDKYPGYDKLVHFIFGIVASYLSLFLIKDLKINKVIGIITITLSLATLWEVYEYICSLIFNVDPQNNLTTGVNDTMQDIIVAFAGSILVGLVYKILLCKVKR